METEKSGSTVAKEHNTPITETAKMLNFADFRKYSNVFIETGSAMGDGIQRALDAGYSVVKSVEAKDDYFSHCTNLYHADDRVKLYFGLSKDRLAEMLSDVKEDAVFWLDAHVSGPNSAGHEDFMAKGDKSDYHQHNALMAELAIITAHMKKNNLRHI